MTDTGQSSENDTRFQFEIIKQLAENGRVLAQSLKEVQGTQVVMLERLVRIESNTVNESVAKLETRVDVMASKVDKLEQLEDRRAGESAVKAAFVKWWPVIGTGFMVIWIIGRALGFFQIPEAQKAQVPQAVSAAK